MPVNSATWLTNIANKGTEVAASDEFFYRYFSQKDERVRQSKKDKKRQVCCSVLQCVAVRCNVLQCVVAC